MDPETVIFLSISMISGIGFLIVLIYFSHKQKVKELEVEALKVREANLKDDIADEVAKQLKDHKERLEVLEAIVTDKNYELNEKITRLK